MYLFTMQLQIMIKASQYTGAHWRDFGGKFPSPVKKL